MGSSDSTEVGSCGFKFFFSKVISFEFLQIVFHITSRYCPALARPIHIAYPVKITLWKMLKCILAFLLIQNKWKSILGETQWKLGSLQPRHGEKEVGGEGHVVSLDGADGLNGHVDPHVHGEA